MIVPFLAHCQGRRENQILSFTNSLSTSCLGQRSRAVAVNPTYKNPHSGGTYILEGEGRQSKYVRRQTGAVDKRKSVEEGRWGCWR